MYPEKNSQMDANWSPDGKRIAFGRDPFIPNSPDVIDMQILDVLSKQVSSIPGSKDLYDPRWSPDGQHLAGLSTHNKKIVIYDFKTQKWSDWITGVGTVGMPHWSHDGKYLYFDNMAGDHPELYPNHPRRSPTVCLSCAYFPVFGSHTATIEVVGNTGKLSSEKAGVGGSTPSLATMFSITCVPLNSQQCSKMFQKSAAACLGLPQRKLADECTIQQRECTY